MIGEKKGHDNMREVSMPLENAADAAVDVIQRFHDLRVLLIGDAILDTYVDGTSSRLCREAPVPVVVRQGEQRFPGGAANTAANLSALGAEVSFLGLTGDDAAGVAVRDALRAAGVGDSGLIVDPAVSTINKLRVSANGQYLVRIDDGDLGACSPASREALRHELSRLLPECDLIVLCDYGCGTISDDVIATVKEARALHPIPLVVDAKEIRRFADVHATAVTPNLDEARAALPAGSAAATPDEIAQRLRAELDAEYIAITMAGGGALLTDSEGNLTHLPTYPVSHAGDVGAGDSFTAAMALALAAGADARLAVHIGIDAASIACTKHRTAVVSQRELVRRASLSGQQPPDAGLTLKELAARLDAERFAGRRIVFTNGVFDILHAGHVQTLHRAREFGDILVVGINSDASVRRLKGPQRPVNHEQDRLALVSALDVVDYALIFAEDTPAEVIRALKPDVHVKGGDYQADLLPEIDAIREVGARVEILPLLNGRSTTNVINQIAAQSHQMPVVPERRAS